jgi:hypothetical protein
VRRRPSTEVIFQIEADRFAGPCIVFDLSWDMLMNAAQQEEVVCALLVAYAFNKESEKSLPMLFTSVGQRWQELFHRANARQWNKQIATFTNKTLLDAVPIQNIVYLTPDAADACGSLDPSKAYVIAGLVGDQRSATVTGDWGRERAIRMERLPIPVGAEWPRIEDVAKKLVMVANGGEWESEVENADTKPA